MFLVRGQVAAVVGGGSRTPQQDKTQFNLHGGIRFPGRSDEKINSIQIGRKKKKKPKKQLHSHNY